MNDSPYNAEVLQLHGKQSHYFYFHALTRSRPKLHAVLSNSHE